MPNLSTLDFKDTINGAEGRAYATIDGNVELMFYLKKLEAKIEKKKTEGKTLGNRATQHKANGWNGTGSMTIYYITSVFRKMLLEYIRTGKDTYFDIQVVNEDPTSNVGKQTTVIKKVNIDASVLAKLDVDSEAMEEEVAFTFEDFDILDEFGKPILG